MTAPGGDDMDRNPGVEEERLVRAAKIVEPQISKTELAGAVYELDRYRRRMTRPGEIGITREGREDQRLIRQLDERQVNVEPLPYPGYQPKMVVSLAREKRRKAVVNGDRADAT